MYSISTNHEIRLILCPISHSNSNSMLQLSHFNYPFTGENVMFLCQTLICNLQELLPVQERNRISEPIILATAPSLFFVRILVNAETIDIPIAQNLRIDVAEAEPIRIANVRLMQRLNHTLDLPKQAQLLENPSAIWHNTYRGTNLRGNIVSFFEYEVLNIGAFQTVRKGEACDRTAHNKDAKLRLLGIGHTCGCCQ